MAAGLADTLETHARATISSGSRGVASAAVEPETMAPASRVNKRPKTHMGLMSHPSCSSTASSSYLRIAKG